VSVLASILLRVFDPTQTGGGAAQLLWNVVQFLVPLVLTFLMFLTLYRFGPRRHNRFRDVWPGALLAALGFEVLKFGYAIYASNFATFDVVYGALGGVLLFMFFTYLAAYIFLMGAELAAEFPGVMAGRHDDEPIPPLETLQSIRARVRTMLSRKS
jgi:membrane protein